jgi:hypothetical protein
MVAALLMWTQQILAHTVTALTDIYPMREAGMLCLLVFPGVRRRIPRAVCRAVLHAGHHQPPAAE